MALCSRRGPTFATGGAHIEVNLINIRVLESNTERMVPLIAAVTAYHGSLLVISALANTVLALFILGCSVVGSCFLLRGLCLNDSCTVLLSLNEE